MQNEVSHWSWTQPVQCPSLRDKNKPFYLHHYKTPWNPWCFGYHQPQQLLVSESRSQGQKNNLCYSQIIHDNCFSPSLFTDKKPSLCDNVRNKLSWIRKNCPRVEGQSSETPLISSNDACKSYWSLISLYDMRLCMQKVIRRLHDFGRSFRCIWEALGVP